MTHASDVEGGKRRSVRRETSATGAEIVKRIETAGLAGLRARRLARREHDVQRALFERGLAVAEPIAFEASDGAVELRQRCIEGARELAEILRGPERAPIALEELARRVGALLAHAHSLALDHPDVHEKNVLVDAAGRPWLIDFHRATIGSRPRADVARRDLVQLAAAARERASVRLLQRALVAWWRKVDARAKPDGDLGTFAAQIDRAARERRRAVLARATKRWERPSSSARAFEIASASGIARVELDDAVLAELVERARVVDRAVAGDAVRTSAFDVVTQLDGLENGATVLVLAGEPARVRDAFLACARLADHAIDVARPIAHVPARSRDEASLALVALPRGARAIDALTPGACTRGGVLAREIGALFGALEDRGLAVAGRARLFADGADRVWLAPPFALRDRPLDRAHQGARAPWAPALESLGDRADASSRAECLDAWRAAQRGGRALDRRLGATLAEALARG